MKNTNEVVEILNDLVQINNDRVAGYEKAINETNELDADLRGTFTQMAQQSRTYIQELTQRIASLGGEPTESTTASGKVYRVWMDLKVAFAGDDRQAILNSCEYGEDAALKTYKAALEDSAELPADVALLIQEQKTKLKASHDMIKKFRDAHELAH